jgi:general secretion pathway protein D
MKKKLTTSSRMISCTLAIATFMAMSPDSFAQFKKYKSKTRYKAQQVQTPKPSEINNFAKGSFSNSASDAKDDSSTFGNRTSSAPAVKDSKYVNLNPETAFGPEIITSFDFPDTDIMEMTRHMQKLTGINLILDKDVKGKVSITAPSPITVGDAWKAYLAALNMAGYTLVKSGAFYKIINSRDVRYVPTEIYTGSYTPDTESHMMKVLSLKNVDAGEISRNFRPFMSRYGRIIDIKQTNTIIISDTGSNIARLERLIKFLDVPGHDEALQIIKVHNSSAQEIAKLLDEILKGGSSSASSARSRVGTSSSARFSGGAKGQSSNSNISKIIAEPRTNSIIAMANAEGERQLRQLINKLDTKTASTNSDKIHVHYLNFGDSEELAKTLSSLVSGTGAATSTARPGARSFTPGTNGSSLFNGEVKVTADKNNNALVVTANPNDWVTLKSVIAKLDIPRDQVYVEGLIVETTINKVKSYGVEYFGAYGRGNAQRGGFSEGGDLTSLLAGNPTSLSGFFLGGGGGGTVEIENPVAGGNPLKVNSVNGLIKAIVRNGNTNVLATPQILAMDNTEAEFEVGATIPVRQTTTNLGVTNESFQNQEAKLTLQITPQINKVTRFVKLKINQSINDFSGPPDAAGGGAATNTRSVVTEVMVKDRDTIAMGGLLRDKEIVSYSKVPLLGDIPVLGWLFKNKSRTVEKVNMLFFLTPKILSPYEKNASENTLEQLSKRIDHLKGDVINDKDMPFAKEVTKLTKKVEMDAGGALSNGSNQNPYQKTNESEGIGPSRVDGGLDVPDYQAILKEKSPEEKEEQ